MRLARNPRRLHLSAVCMPGMYVGEEAGATRTRESQKAETPSG